MVSTVVVSVVSVVSVMTSSVMVRVMEVLRDGMLVARVTLNTTVARAAWISGGLELLLDSAVLVLAIVVKVMTVAATSGFVVSLVTGSTL